MVVLTGPGAAQILDSVFVGTRRKAAQIPSGSIAHGRMVRDGATVDEVVVAYFDGPSSPTGEPFFEVNCHGGIVAVQSVLACLRQAGARVVPWQSLSLGHRPASGILSATSLRAAALARLPRAQTRLAARMLLHQAKGALSSALDAVRCDLLAARAGTSAAVPSPAMAHALDALHSLLAMAPLGMALLDPAKVLIAGPPNVGKSSLLNALLHRERVIVHPHPGTTRDVVREVICIAGVPFELIDSAGMRQGADDQEQLAVRKAADLFAGCDVLLLVYDVREPLAEALKQMPPLQTCARTIMIGNKIDLWAQPHGRAAHIFISARQARNLDQVEAALLAPYRDLIPACEAGGPVIFTHEVQATVERVAARLEEDGPEEGLRELEASGV
jgi:tRNA modification GTPase